jgi:hypothetical protein
MGAWFILFTIKKIAACATTYWARGLKYWVNACCATAQQAFLKTALR